MQRNHAYQKSLAVLRRHGVQYPEMLDAAAFSEYCVLRAEEDHAHAAAEGRRVAALRAALIRSRATRLRVREARRLKVAEILRARPEAKMKTVMTELSISKSTLRRDRIALGLLGPSPVVCPTCGRP
jgi:hypothetical protein